MKVRKGDFCDGLVYGGLCLLSLGVVWFTRIIISTAIRCALKEEEEK